MKKTTSKRKSSGQTKKTRKKTTAKNSEQKIAMEPKFNPNFIEPVNEIKLTDNFKITADLTPRHRDGVLKIGGLQQFLMHGSAQPLNELHTPDFSSEYDDYAEVKNEVPLDINNNSHLYSKFTDGLTHSIMNTFIKGIIISRQGGDVLYFKHIQGNLDFNLMSNFLAALNIFGEENIGKINRILIHGQSVELNVVQKHELILTVVFQPNHVKDHFNFECETALDMFYNQYKTSIDQNRGNQSIYKGFDKNLLELMKSYMKRIGS